MEKIVDYLTNIPAWFLATCDGDQPHVRPFSFAAVDDGKLWFCTATNKDVYQQLCANPKFELSGWNPGDGWIVVTGTVSMEDTASETVRLEGYKHMTGIGETYEGPNDPRLTFFSMEQGVAKIADIDGSEEIIYVAQ